jgi:uncharacterized metal-binding protein YceD (DUF177 family)
MMKGSEPLWSVKVPVEAIPETGQHIEIEADAATRTALAKDIGLRDLSHAQAAFNLSRHGAGGVRVRGKVSAVVGQNCVVTLDPIETRVAEEFDLLFAPAQAPADEDAEEIVPLDGREPPEALQDGAVDLGAIATEFLILGIDFYPRKPDVVFEPPPAGDPAAHPFAALAALKLGKTGDKE